MSDVAIMGAGELGGTLAHVLARRDAATSIKLIDESRRVAQGKALDITHAAPLEGFASEVSGTDDFMAAAGAAVIVIAEPARTPAQNVDDGLILLERLVRVSSGATFVCAGESHRELVERAARELPISRMRIIGSAPEALATGARALVALECRASPADVSLAVLGVPPAHIVVSWEHATIAGFALTGLIDEPARRRLATRIGKLWPPGPYGLATAAMKIVETLLGGSRRLASCFVAPDDSLGARMRGAALPVRIGPGGVTEVLSPVLSVAEQVALDNATLL